MQFVAKQGTLYTTWTKENKNTRTFQFNANNACNVEARKWVLCLCFCVSHKMHHLVLCRYMHICVAQCKMHYSYNALECNPMCNLQLHPNALQNALHVLTMHCNASKAGKRETSTWNGKKVAQQECELFQTSFFRMRGVVGRQKGFLSTSSLSKSFGFFLMQSWASCR